MKKQTLILTLLLIGNIAFCQKQAYLIYNAKGKKISYKKVIKNLAKKDIILFGELHNNPIAHWLEFELATDLNNTKTVILGAEMLEADNQEIIDDYLNNKINYKKLDSLARLWPNYKTDYAPLVNFAKEKKLHFIATNIPRKYASLVYKKEFKALDSLSANEKKWIAPLPIPFDSELPTYKKILSMMGEHGSPKLVMAQAIKDATMAHFILKNYKPGQLFLHYNGAFHSNYHEGILWYLKKGNNSLNYATLSTVFQDDIYKFSKEDLDKADFIIYVDSNMTTTY